MNSYLYLPSEGKWTESGPEFELELLSLIPTMITIMPSKHFYTKWFSWHYKDVGDCNKDVGDSNKDVGDCKECVRLQ